MSHRLWRRKIWDQMGALHFCYSIILRPTHRCHSCDSESLTHMIWVIWLLLLGFDLWPCDLFLSFLLGAILEKCNYFFIYLIFYYFRIWIMAAGQGQGKGKGKGGTGKSSDGGKNKPKSVSRWAQQFILPAKADNQGKGARLTLIGKFSGYFTKTE